MNQILSLIFGLIVSIAAVVSMQIKDIKRILICQLVCNAAGALSYIFVGGISGCGIYLAAIFQSLVYFLFRITNKNAPRYLAVIFLFVFLLCSISTYQGTEDIISAAAAITCALGLAQEKASGYRICMLLNGIIWTLYDINVTAYSMIIPHMAVAISSGIGMVRFDMKKQCN